MTSPLFPEVKIIEGSGHTLTITGSHAPDMYIDTAHLAIGSGGSSPWNKPWLPPAAPLGGGEPLGGLGHCSRSDLGGLDVGRPTFVQSGRRPGGSLHRSRWIAQRVP